MKAFPEVDAGFYLNCRSNFIHMGLDVPLFSIKNYPDFIDEINKFLSKELGASAEKLKTTKNEFENSYYQS